MFLSYKIMLPVEATYWLWYSGANQNVGPSVGELHLMWL